MTEEEEKQKYAEALLIEPDPFKAGMVAFNQNIQKALVAAQVWFNDSDFFKIQQAAKREKGKEALPNKFDLAVVVWQKMNGSYVPADDFAKLAKLYAEINGFIEKAPTVAINTNITQNKVMLVPKYPNAETWEEKAVNQQHQLTSNAATRH